MENTIIKDGELDLVGLKLPCYILENGTRVISGRAMQNALKVGDISDKKEEDKPGGELPRFLASKWFKTLADKRFGLEHFSPIICYKGNQKINGYEATVLVDICDLVLQARNDKDKPLTAKQKIIAAQCEILVRSFAKVGIIALIDEATGYQYEREQKELQVIFKTFVSDEILEWQQAFHLSFYKEIFRLWGIPFTEKYIRRKPQFLGHLTNSLVYANLPKGTFVLQKLKEKTPKTELGNWKYKLHQSLTKEQGREALKKVIYTIEALASVAENKRQFLKLVANKYGQKEIPFEDLDNIKELPQPQSEPLSTFNQKLVTALNYNPKKKEAPQEPDAEQPSLF